MAQMTQELLGKEWFLAEYERREGRDSVGRDGAARAWLGALRRAAIERFGELGFPSQRQEAWRFTSVAPLTQTAFQAASVNPAVEEQARVLAAAHALGGDEGARAVFVNGHFSSALSSLKSLEPGVTILSLAEAFANDPRTLELYLSRVAPFDEHSFIALNTAFMADGALVTVARGQVVEKPLHLLFISIGGEEPTVTHPRNLVVVGESSQLRFVETYVGEGAQPTFTNAVTEIVAGENAVVDHYKLQDESEVAFHFATQKAELARAANLTSTSIAVGGRLVRNETGVLLGGEGAECTLNGLYLARGRQHVDNHTRMDHAHAHCTSRQLYKGILDEAGSAVFNGRILVRPDAQKTDAIQSNRNLLLTETATVNTQPQLEIFADDVRCTHGATIGQLDAESIFYLRTRGIDRETARGLLTYAFANEVIERIRVEPLRARLERLVAQRFRRGGELEEATEE
jgi:Fe-S cluster assembly protein SufD